MRSHVFLTTMLLSLALVLAGCMENTGDVGNKNIRQSAINKKRFAIDQNNDQNRVNGTRQENNNIVGMHGNSRIELSDNVAQKVNEIPGIDSVLVMMTDHNAYVAVEQDVNGMGATSVDLPDAFKDKIADRVKSLSPSTENVYVSTNPDFLSRMQGYANNVKQGHPIQGLLVEFNAMVERIFPAPSGAGIR